MFCGQENRRCIARRDARKSWRHAEARCVKLRARRRPLSVPGGDGGAAHALARGSLSGRERDLDTGADEERQLTDGVGRRARAAAPRQGARGGSAIGAPAAPT
jgi:hypothetical protein